MNDQDWDELSKFESRDFISTWYERRHKRSLNAAQAKAISTCFVLGRNYFEAAAGSAQSVKPLLLYYGVLSLSRGLILLLNKEKNEESLRASHGLEGVDWRGILAKGNQNILELPVRATRGTFEELVKATRNRQATSWWYAPRMITGSYHIEYGIPRFIEDGSTITLDDLLSRDQRFGTLYQPTTGRSPKVHLGEVIAQNGHGIDLSIYSGKIPPEQFEKSFGPFGNQQSTFRDKGDRLPIPNTHIQILNSDLNAAKQQLPAHQFVGNDGMWILENFDNGDKLSELVRTFLLSYSIGMLVRYFPTQWVALLHNEKGDFAQPILLAASKRIASDYPKLVQSALA